MALWAAITTAAVAAGLRLPIVDFGLPFLWHPDEPSNISIGAAMVDHGAWNPHSFLYPSLLYDVVAIVGRMQRAVGGWHLGGGQSIQVMGTGYTTDPHLYLALRLVTVALSVGACIIVFGAVNLVTKRWWAAATAGLLLAVSPLMVLNGVYITPDTYSAFFTAFGLLAALWVLRRGRRLDYLIAGVAVGLAAGAKYDPSVVAISVVIAHFLRSPAQAGDRRTAPRHHHPAHPLPRWLQEAPLLVWAAITAVLAFVLTTPGAIISPHKFISDIRYVELYFASGHAGVTGSSIVFYEHVLTHQGLVFTLLIACGLVALLGAWWREALVVLGFVVCYTALISAQAVHYDRELLPSVVGMALLAGIGVATATDLVRTSVVLHKSVVPQASKMRTGLTLLAVGIVVLGLGSSALTSTRSYAQVRQHPRAEAQTWIYQHIPRGSAVVVEIYGPWLDTARYHVTPVTFVTTGSQKVIPPKAAAIVVTQYGSGRFLAHPGVFKPEVAAYANLVSRYCQGADYTDGPWIRIFVPCARS
jgi:4-amino-4-deoxy-L-arabinose transferase-like glycosyltransferase